QTGSFDISSSPGVINFVAVPSQANSRIDFNPTGNVLANGHDSVQVTVTIHDFSNTAIQGLSPHIDQTNTSDVSFIQPGATGGTGIAIGSMTATGPGTKTIPATLR